jgi:hypothetical protein
MKQMFKIITILGVLFMQAALAKEVRVVRYCRTEMVWQKQTGKEITEENLVESLKLDWETQRKQIYDQIDAMNQDVKDGRITKEEFRDYVEAMPVPCGERNAALKIIAAAKFQSPEIDRVVLEIYVESMDNPLERSQCIEVMLNNAPEQGIQMAHEFLTNEVRELHYRMMVAMDLVKHGFLVSQELINEGLASERKNTRSLTKSVQRKLGQLKAGKPREPVETVAPPHNPVVQEPEPTTNAPVKASTNRLPVKAPQSATAEPLTNPWKFLLPALGVLLVGIAVVFKFRK